MRILVTGAAGFIGSWVVDRLLAGGHEVVGLDNFDPFYDRRLKERNLTGARDHEAFTFFEGDLLDRGLVRRLLEDPPCQAVIHLAALAGVRPSIERPMDYERVNVLGTMTLLEAARAVHGMRLVLASSSSVYGVRSRVPFEETDPCDEPASPYAATKRCTEILAYNYHHLYGMPIRMLRYFTVYGPRQRPEMAIALFARRIASGEPITLFGDGSSARDYTYVDDIVSGTIATLEHCADGYEIFNIGGTRTTSLVRLVELLEGALGRKAVLRHLPDQPGDVPITCASVEKLRRAVGYDPRVPIEEGIERYVAYLETKAP
ncbi:MAG: GDP-mannose 4,6-dehydratase [Polyangia bacterium]|jgi:UDP-glucuronate 4-epimerase|nr:GDP-mannose 4,6-dehydratase [Polyangia bacterium]